MVSYSSGEEESELVEIPPHNTNQPTRRGAEREQEARRHGHHGHCKRAGEDADGRVGMRYLFIYLSIIILNEDSGSYKTIAWGCNSSSIIFSLLCLSPLS